jgi:hypothetical protein
MPRIVRHDKAPQPAGLCLIFAYLPVPMPEPGPLGVSVDPLGEAPAPTELPDGFILLFGPVAGAVERAVLPVVPPLTDGLVVPLAAGLPTEEPAPAEPVPLCASANVLDSARAEASAMVESFMVVSSLACRKNKSQRRLMFRI